MSLKRLQLLWLALLLNACAITNLEEPAELVDFDQEAEFVEVWNHSLDDEGEELLLGLRPVSDGRNVYVADHAGNVVALDAATGKPVWEIDTDEEGFFGEGLPFSAGPTVAQGRVVVGSLDGDLLVLDAATGETVWQANVDAELLAAPVIAEGRVLVRTGDNRLLTYDLANGNPLWDTLRDMPLLSIRGQAQPAVKGDDVFVAWDNGKIASIAIRNGSLNWETAIGQPVGKTEVQQLSDIDGDVVVFGTEVYVAGHNTNVAALAIESGEMLWRDEISAVRGPAVSFGTVVVTDIDSVLRAYDRLSGTSLWTQDVVRARYLTAPALWKEFVVVGDLEGYLHFFDRTTGRMLARIEHDGYPVQARPLVTDQGLVVLSSDGEVSMYRQVANELDSTTQD